MEDVLDVYTAAPDPEAPLICMDEAAKQLLDDLEPPLALAPGKPAREDYHYVRCGTCALFLFFDPHQGWRRVSARPQRRRCEWAEEIRRLLEEDYPQASKIRLVCDNLNTHHIASLYETFPPEKARALARRLEIHYTPRNGSWLNVAEIELSVLAAQCLARRIPDLDTLSGQIQAWAHDRNREKSTVSWHFTHEDARIKLRHLYPICTK